MKFKLQKEQHIDRNIQFPKELFNKINNIKGNISLNKFVIQAVKYAIDNMEESDFGDLYIDREEYKKRSNI